MMTLTEYDAHRELMAKRDAIISELRNEDATHLTICRAWHGYEIEAGTPLVLSPEIGALLGRSEIRDSHGCVSHWFILKNGHIANLWACEVNETN